MSEEKKEFLLLLKGRNFTQDEQLSSKVLKEIRLAINEELVTSKVVQILLLDKEYDVELIEFGGTNV